MLCKIFIQASALHLLLSLVQRVDLSCQELCLFYFSAWKCILFRLFVSVCRCGSVEEVWRCCPVPVSPILSAPTSLTPMISLPTCAEMLWEWLKCGWMSLKATSTWPGTFHKRWGLLCQLLYLPLESPVDIYIHLSGRCFYPDVSYKWEMLKHNSSKGHKGEKLQYKI